MAVPTSEITKALSSFDTSVLKDVLKTTGGSTVGKKDKLVQAYEDAVMEVGVKGFVSKLAPSAVTAAATALGVEDNVEKLLAELKSASLSKLLTTVPESVLKEFSATLALDDTSDRKEMEQNIADEVMLTGMESFLNNLSVQLLKDHCKELKQKVQGSKKELVERIMVVVFELEPLKDDAKNGGKKEKSKDTKKDSKKKTDKKDKKDSKKDSKKDKKDTKKDTKKDKKDTKDKKDKKEKSEKSESSTRKKRKADSDEEPPVKKPKGPAVRPPISTIKKGVKGDGLHNKFNATDLRDWCKENGLMVSGKKPILIKRIVKFLDTGVKDEPKVGNSKKSSSKKRKASKTDDEAASSTAAAGDAKEAKEAKEVKEAKETKEAKKPKRAATKKGKGKADEAKEGKEGDKTEETKKD